MAAVSFIAIIKKFKEQGEKTGWTYIEVPATIAEAIKPGVRTAYRVKGKLDHYSFRQIALVPMGEGQFILPLKAAIRKAIRKEKGATLSVTLSVDDNQLPIPSALVECFKDDPDAAERFKQLPKSHQHYFIRWIGEAKTDGTKAKRIAHTLNALVTGLSFSEMLRKMKEKKADHW